MSKNSPLWHPFTQHALFPDSVHIKRAEGAYLYDKDGRQIIDAISSWWVNTHGHCHPKIVKAVQDQAEMLEQVIFAGFTHAPAEALAEKLVAITDPTLTHVFLSDSGSTAVEAALKMAIGYFAQTGGPRRKIVALEGGYHGDTFGAMSAGARGVFSRLYEPYLFEVSHLPFPDENAGTLEKFETLLKGGDVAALIAEPLIQGAAGMRMFDPGMLKALHDLCRKYGALFIADEVMTGFGRTGTMFACEQAGIAPDLLCLSKGLTGGFLPMGATLATQEIYDAFYHEDRAKMFFHSSSFTGNALSCAAAVASLEIWEEEPVLERITKIAAAHEGAVQRFAKDTIVENARCKGPILALDIKDTKEGYLSDLAPRLLRFFMERGVLLRPIGNTVYVLPPYCVTENDLELIYESIADALDLVRHEGKQRAA